MKESFLERMKERKRLKCREYARIILLSSYLKKKENERNKEGNKKLERKLARKNKRKKAERMRCKHVVF